MRFGESPRGTNRIAGVGLNDVFRSKDGRLWKVVGIAETPTVTIEHVATFDFLPIENRERHHLVIGSGHFKEFEQLVPKEDV